MPLAAGTRLGPYELVSPLGAGGMGEVYRARDTRLDRTVAIKILPESLAGDVEFRERFDREARAISQLDHPHICALYDVGQQERTAYLVMQYLEGETLAQRLAKGALPTGQALQIATQIADALARAHRAGIVHRDLKPGNIMLTKAGASLLDFGLAKNGAAVNTSMGDVSVETTPARLTAQGTILGTFHYMAPEQIEGGDADARSDIWAFGCVLYEMLTGTRPFSGKSHASLLANILTAEPPPVTARQPLVTGNVDHVVRRCLEKDPEQRWQSMTDIAHELRWTATAGERERHGPVASWRHLPLYIGAFLLVFVAAFALWMARGTAASSSAPAPLVKATVLPPPGLTLAAFGSNGTPHFALSPDGQRLAFVAYAVGRPPSLWVRRLDLDSRLAQEIPGSEDASAPFWSADGQSLGFFAEGKVKTIGLQGQRPKIVATIPDAAGGSWARDVILVGRSSGPVVRVAASAGAKADATVARADAGGHRWPQFLPDGERFIYTDSRGGVMMATLGSTASTELLQSRATAVYTPGYFLFARATALLAQPVDARTLAPSGSVRELLDAVGYAGGSGYPPVSLANGLLAYWDGTGVATEPRWFDRDGTRLATVAAPPESHTFAISPDDTRVAFSRPATQGRGRAAVWLMDAAGAVSRFSLSDGGATGPLWSKDGGHISYSSGNASRIELLRRPVSGIQQETTLGAVEVAGATGGPGNYYATSWSSDGRTALLSVSAPETTRDIVAFNIDTRQVTPLFHGEAYEIQGTFAPGDRWIAYATNKSGRWEVFVDSFPIPGQGSQVSIDGGSQPVWRKDGKELFFLDPDGRLMAVPVTVGPTFTHDSPKVLFKTAMRPTYAPFPVGYDVTSDGQRFLIDSVRSGTAATISLVVNWDAAAAARK